MKRNHKNVWFLSGIAAGIVVSIAIAAAVYYSLYKEENNRETIAFDNPVPYDESIRQVLCNLLEEGTNVALYLEEKNAMITNPDFNRNAVCDMIGVAGDASVLFPGSNALLNGEEGYCILGKKTAFELFGSTKVSGRTVAVNGKIYQVAGITYEKENMCAYELSANQEAMTENIAFLYTSQSEKGILTKKLKNLFL